MGGSLFSKPTEAVEEEISGDEEEEENEGEEGSESGESEESERAEEEEEEEVEEDRPEEEDGEEQPEEEGGEEQAEEEEIEKQERPDYLDQDGQIVQEGEEHENAAREIESEEMEMPVDQRMQESVEPFTEEKEKDLGSADLFFGTECNDATGLSPSPPHPFPCYLSPCDLRPACLDFDSALTPPPRSSAVSPVPRSDFDSNSYKDSSPIRPSSESGKRHRSPVPSQNSGRKKLNVGTPHVRREAEEAPKCTRLLHICAADSPTGANTTPTTATQSPINEMTEEIQ
eukprot:GHVS01053797.1.p1 GENE.GHVS01053797.1~~GHVS01053797.1.p1  ORF type:complete len:286 (+),score=97.02 GHVS01053797.1:298-1155(+)